MALSRSSGMVGSGVAGSSGPAAHAGEAVDRRRDLGEARGYRPDAADIVPYRLAAAVDAERQRCGRRIILSRDAVAGIGAIGVLQREEVECLKLLRDPV